MRAHNFLWVLGIAATALLVDVLWLESRLWAGSVPEKQKILDSLVEGAKKEGELVAWGISSLGEDGSKVYGEAFKARFGLKNLRFKYDMVGQTGEKFSRAVMETRMGMAASYDVMNGSDHRVGVLIEADAVEPVQDWELLLPEGVNPRFASPPAVRGIAFAFANRTKGNVYNTKLTSDEEMPRTTRDVALPKYKGKFYTSPWTTDAPVFGILFYPKEEWLEIMRGWGRNKVTTIRPTGGVVRMMLGEFAFEPFSNAYLSVKHKQKGDPAGLHVFKDFTPLAYIFNIVRKNGRHPNAAKLFALWATGPEAVQIFEKYSGTGNIHIKESRVGAEVMRVVRNKGGKLVSWSDSKENLKVLKWYMTKEGQNYEDRIAEALGLK